MARHPSRAAVNCENTLREGHELSLLGAAVVAASVTGILFVSSRIGSKIEVLARGPTIAKMILRPPTAPPQRPNLLLAITYNSSPPWITGLVLPALIYAGAAVASLSVLAAISRNRRQAATGWPRLSLPRLFVAVLAAANICMVARRVNAPFSPLMYAMLGAQVLACVYLAVGSVRAVKLTRRGSPFLDRLAGVAGAASLVFVAAALLRIWARNPDIYFPSDFQTAKLSPRFKPLLHPGWHAYLVHDAWPKLPYELIPPMLIMVAGILALCGVLVKLASIPGVAERGSGMAAPRTSGAPFNADPPGVPAPAGRWLPLFVGWMFASLLSAINAYVLLRSLYPMASPPNASTEIELFGAVLVSIALVGSAPW